MPVCLNLADWIERRKPAVGPYADHIIHSVRAHEAEIEKLRASLEEIMCEAGSSTRAWSLAKAALSPKEELK